MEPREPEKKRRRAPEHLLETDEQRRARLHERNERDRARRRTESKEQRKTRLAKRNVRDRDRRRECTESAEDKAARAEQVRARRRAESAEHRAARLEQMRGHNNERLATESEQECYHAFQGPRPEASKNQARGIEQLSHEKINYLCEPKKTTGHSSQHKKRTFSQNQCRKCGLNWPHVESPCPAAGKNCRNCGKANHFARMCWSNKTHYTQQGQPQQKSAHKHKSQVHQISVTPPQDDNSDDEEFLFVVGQGVNDKKALKVTVEFQSA